MSDAITPETLRRWAEDRYGLTGIQNVEFADEGWEGTDVTPGDPFQTRVSVTEANGEQRHYFEDSPTDLINSIVRFWRKD